MTTTAAHALLAVAKSADHAYSCSHVETYRRYCRVVPYHHKKKWQAAREHAKRVAPACDCHMRLVYGALAGLGIPYPDGVPEWLENGPDFGKDEED